MTMHVFGLHSWGFTHHGEFVKETEKTITHLVRWGSNVRATRLNKSPYLYMVETDDPKAVKAAFDAEWAKHDADVNVAREAYSAAQVHQKSAALKAAIGTVDQPVGESV